MSTTDNICKYFRSRLLQQKRNRSMEKKKRKTSFYYFGFYLFALCNSIDTWSPHPNLK